MAEQLFYEDVVVNQLLPTLVKHTTPRQLVMWAGASGEFSEMHYDKEFALSRGFPGIIVHGMLMTSFLAQLLTDWMGEWGTLKKIKTSNRQFILVNQDIVCKGKVCKKYVQGEEPFVECELWAENEAGEKCVVATALITLPERKESGSSQSRK
jgi:hydroxyacyl-ACP dehydratase HTD2-like protein with hotdog domain